MGADDSKDYLVITDFQGRAITMSPASRLKQLVTKTERIPMSDAIKKAIEKAELSEAGQAGITAAIKELDAIKGELPEGMFDKVVTALSQAISGKMEDVEGEKEKTQAACDERDTLKTSLEAALKALDVENPEVGKAADVMAKALDTERKVKHEDDLPEHIKARLDEAIKKAEDAEARVVKAEQKAARNEQIVKCKSDYGKVPMKPEAMADLLISLSDDARKSCEDMLSKFQALASKSKALDEIGGTGADAGTGALGKLKAIAKSYQESNPEMSEVEAMNKAQRNNPELRREYEEQRRDEQRAR